MALHSSIVLECVEEQLCSIVQAPAMANQFPIVQECVEAVRPRIALVSVEEPVSTIAMECVVVRRCQIAMECVVVLLFRIVPVFAMVMLCVFNPFWLPQG